MTLDPLSLIRDQFYSVVTVKMIRRSLFLAV
jgi:hypothetical protein